jgi:hypothetical protein
MNRIAPLACLALIAACTTVSAASRLEDRFIAFGLEPALAGCLVGELKEDLSSQEIGAVADFIDEIEGVDRSGRPGAIIDTIMSMDNPEIVASVAAAGVSCAFRR